MPNTQKRKNEALAAEKSESNEADKMNADLAKDRKSTRGRKSKDTEKEAVSGNEQAKKKKGKELVKRTTNDRSEKAVFREGENLIEMEVVENEFHSEASDGELSWEQDSTDEKSEGNESSEERMETSNRQISSRLESEEESTNDTSPSEAEGVTKGNSRSSSRDRSPRQCRSCKQRRDYSRSRSRSAT